MRKFLIVDDNVALAENLAEIIADADLGETVLAENGAQALTLAANTQFHALVSDLRMPHMSGRELFQRIRLVDPGLPAVFISAYTPSDEFKSTRQEGILGILPKPIPIARLLVLLADARRGRRHQQDDDPFTTGTDPEQPLSVLETLFDRGDWHQSQLLFPPPTHTGFSFAP